MIRIALTFIMLLPSTFYAQENCEPNPFKFVSYLEVESLKAVISSSEESPAFNRIYMAASISDGKNVGQVTLSLAPFYILDEVKIFEKGSCEPVTQFLAAKYGIIYGFESLEDLEEGFYSERLGFIEGEEAVFDRLRFEVLSGVKNYHLKDSDEVFEEFEIYLIKKGD